ncbi:GCN5 family acetyltransferase [Elizabethkingia meningoseptica]|uniref:GNAT family N-acetyltransferase n=1 Tax=Elizabethkingia meningoseptica TaxID=238 RepID=A0A1V3U528_ELIME|nr:MULTISPECIES: GNAT family protein [Elizabethkingia]AQX11292.1 GCN5 family acetyltransferase [Elizabethkingia meningoseptica]MBG0512636.1 GNAT family N-acetyltransferase [Elizabethkingia meningoseptica]MDE5435238.1 GNAT family N-acetyltransferase [Elizabethkingia meningoseptica]MDE5450415.1 GNAT family N-acetyltransferase [Elizabethkingia meningoseptica]MDE5472122.1 GNAT family N-acetyltransferase [Elizabethkingia meningoseptica]
MKLNFNKEYILENERVLLSPMKEDDFNRLLEFSENEPEIWDYSTLYSYAAGKDNLKKYIDFALDSREKNLAYPFIVYDKLKNRVAGSTRFYNINLDQKILEIGYTWYGKDFQGTGLNKNCKYLLLEFAFDILEMERVGFIADNSNQKSIMAMKSIGCQVEGVLRNNVVKKNGSRRDSIILSILKNEWLDSVKEHLANKIK